MAMSEDKKKCFRLPNGELVLDGMTLYTEGKTIGTVIGRNEDFIFIKRLGKSDEIFKYRIDSDFLLNVTTDSGLPF